MFTKALVRRSPYTPTKPAQDEVFLQSLWPDWADQDTGEPFTNESFGYALCDGFEYEPSEEYPSVSPSDFTITEGTKTIIDEMGEERTVKYWTAVYTPANQS